MCATSSDIGFSDILVVSWSNSYINCITNWCLLVFVESPKLGDAPQEYWHPVGFEQVRSVAHAELVNPNATATKLTLKVRLKIVLFFILIPLDYKKSQLIE